MEDLNELRKQINEIDDELVELFLKRMEQVKKVGIYKQNNSMGVLDKSREESIIKKYIEITDDLEQKDQIKDFFEGLLSISRKAQYELISENILRSTLEHMNQNQKIGYLGVQGSNSYEAMVSYFGEEAESCGYTSFKDVFEALKNGEIKYGIVPIENSSTGGIAEVYDLLNVYNAFIVGEKCMDIDNHLLGVQGADIDTIEEVYSHPQVFLQCNQFFSMHPEWHQVPHFNTAKSAEHVAMQNDRTKACVASKKAAELYGLHIIQKDINNNKINNTRFIIISKGMELNYNNDKISIVMIIPNKAGALYSILKYFSDKDINMVKIESRPIADKAWRYYFYIDINGNLGDENTNNALKLIEKETIYYKLLGNYKADNRS